MNRMDAIFSLSRYADAIKSMGATALYLYGSTASDETHRASDLDLFIDYDPAGPFNAFHLMGIKQMLENALEIPIDLTTRDGLHPRLRTRIEQSAVRVL